MAVKYGAERSLKKRYYSISEVSSITGVDQAVLRSWEERFPILNPARNRAGNRNYTMTDFQLVQFIRHLRYVRYLSDDEIRLKLATIKKSEIEDELRGLNKEDVSDSDQFIMPMQVTTSVSPTVRKVIRQVLSVLRD